MTVEMCAAVLSSYLPEPHAALMNGILYGLPLKASPRFYAELRTVGLLHLVVLSGTNITIVGNITGSILRFLPKRISLVLSICTIVAFTIFVGPQPPLVRSAIMGSLGLISTLYGKKGTALISLLVSVLLVVAFKEEWVRSLSFQLSCAATLGIILLGGNGKGIRGQLRTSLAAQAFTAPLIFLTFREISLISPLATLLVSFLVAPLMVIGALTTVVGFVHHSLGILPGYLCFALLQYMVWVIHILSRLPFVYFKFHP